MTQKAEQQTALLAYSEGRIGWREAGKRLAVVDHRELADLLDEAGLPQPQADDAPLDDDTAERFAALLKGKA